ncbi:hypothetical protein GIB67_043073 [Kingdonia uniflora]|uniref:Uncharacterized protein n=1 Tax=Kingdonia uniflora TaxID=39325 RepID=A0A7J7M9U9_9MAGN|nr:hypothetical protein GIB67_043073 [Kingdonia uniflora]
MSALGHPQDMFSDTAIQLHPVFAQWIQNTHAFAPGATTPSVTASTSLTWGVGVLVAVGGKVALLPIPFGTVDFLVHHIHAFTIHVTVLILLKSVLFARSSRLIPNKANLGFRFPYVGPGRGGTCQVSAWDHANLGLFWMYNSISVVIFHFSWKMQSDVWGSINDQGVVTHITGGNFAQSSITINSWLHDFLWEQASQVIQSYGSSLSAYGLFFLGAHFVWAFSLMFPFSGRGYWQEPIESIIWAHNKLKVAPATQPRALSIVQGRVVGGEYVRWNNFLDVLPHPQGLGPLFTGQWNVYAQNPNSGSHLFSASQGVGTAILTLLGGFHPQTHSLWLTDMAHHHLAIAFNFFIVGHMYRANFGIAHNMKDHLEAHMPPGGRLGCGYKGLYDTINNLIHFQLGLALASLGVITSLVAQHMYSLPAYAFIAQEFTTQAALYTHQQYIAGFIMTGTFSHGVIFFIRDYNLEQNEDNILARML